MFNYRAFLRMVGLLCAILLLTAKGATLFAQDASTVDLSADEATTAQPATAEPALAPFVATPLTTDTPETAGAVVVTSNPVQFVPNQIIVKLAAPPVAQVQASGAQATTLLQSLAQADPAVTILNVEPLFRQSASKPVMAAQAETALAPAARQQISQSGLDRIYAITLQGDPAQLVAALQTNPAVEYAQLNYLRHTVAQPNDTLYPHLWGLTNVQAANAWDVATGSGVIVAVIDTGVALTHPDLQGNLYTKPGEIAGNGLDDDNNGFIDDVNGWDFANNDNNPNDGHGHGSHVAGTIAAVGNNNRGVIGLAYQSRILPIKALGDNGSGADAQLANAILYAVHNGAQVINNSWGGPGESPLFEDVINYAHAHGVVVVSAAGNDNQNACGFTPANVENSLAVAAVGPTDAKAGYSNFGVKVDVAAPGGSNINAVSENILSTVPNGAFASAAGFTGPNGEEYRAIAGTSMASPHVAALAALILQLHPTWTPEQVRQVIRQSSNDIGAAGFDPQSGYGRINAQQAVNFGNNAPPSAAIRRPRNCAIVNGAVPVAGVASTTALVTYTVEVGAGETPATFMPLYTGNSAVVSGTLATIDTTLLPDGPATIRLRVRDANGLISEERNMVTVDNTQITAPTNQQLFAANMTPSVAVYGRFATTVAGTPFSQYKLEYAHSSTPTNYVTILTANTLPPASGLLGNWSLTGVADGAVNLRLTVQHGAYSSSDEITVIVDQLLKPGWPATAGHNGLFVGADGAPVGYAFKSPMVADLDRNGSNEIVYGATVLQTNGTVRPGWNTQPGLGRTNPVILDIDQNGSLEVVAALFTQWSSHPSYTNEPNYGAPIIYAYTHDKSVLWSYPIDNPAASTGYDSGLPSSLSAGDVDGDGQVEIVFSIWFNYNNPTRQTTLFVLNAATGAVEQRFMVDGDSYSAVALGNLDGDAALELVLNSYRPSNSTGVVYALNADGSLVAGWPQTMSSDEGAGQIDPVLADVDQDGQLEVLVGKNLWRSNGVAYPGWPFVDLARSTGNFAQLDSDPALELILGGGNHVLYWGMDDNGAILSQNLKSDENLYEFLSGENGTQGVPILADLNGDGKADLLRPSEMGYVDRRAGKLYGAEPGVSGSSLPSFPRYLASPGWGIIRSSALVDDIDCDGKTDLLVAGGDKLYAWNLNTSFNRANNPWPTFQHDRLHTGNYQAVVSSVSACDQPSGGSVTIANVWTDVDGSGNHGDTFAQGALINYTALTSNTTGSTQVVPMVWNASGPCGPIMTQSSPTWPIDAGTQLWYVYSTVPLTACPGVYTLTTSIQYQGVTSSKSWQFTVFAATGPLLAPNQLLVSTMADDQLRLTWADRATNELGYKLERCQVTTGTTCTTYGPLATVGVNVTTFTDSGRTANTRYCYRLRGYNNSGVSAYSNVACRTTAPPPPSNLSGQPLSRTQIKLTWLDNATNEAGVKIERCQGSGCTNFSQIATRAANITTFTNGALTPNTIYCYRVRAYNANGNSRYSNTVCPQTMALAVNGGDGLAETAFDQEGTSIAIADRPHQLQLTPQQQYPLAHSVVCVDDTPAQTVTLWVGEVGVAMQPDATQAGRYQATIAVQEQFATAATYPLVVRWHCANETEPFEEFIGTMSVMSATAAPEPNRFFLPVTLR